MYADDTTLLLRNRAELKAAEAILEIFEKGSGAKVNADKSELIPLTNHPVENNSHVVTSTLLHPRLTIGHQSPHHLQAHLPAPRPGDLTQDLPPPGQEVCATGTLAFLALWQRQGHRLLVVDHGI